MEESNSIFTVEQLIAALRHVPQRRAVSCIETATGHGDYPDDPYPAVLEYPSDDPRGEARFIAWVVDDSEARKLLDLAYDADCRCDHEKWAELPLRHGPYCGTWVLPEHPKSPRICGGEGE